MADDATRLGLLKFSYAEVLDATKHQDDKIGRQVGAIAFLAGGALVFANKDILRTRYLVSQRTWPLPAVLLALFVGTVLAAVALLMIASSAPLTLPRRAKEQATSHLYFQLIAAKPPTAWPDLWRADVAALGATIEEELVEEIKNLADRASKKYRRSNIATNVFLASLSLLAPTVVLAVDGAANNAEASSGASAVASVSALPWTGTRQGIVAGAIVVFSFVLLGSLASAQSHRRGLWWIAFVYPGFLASIIVAGTNTALARTGQPVVLVLGVACACFVWKVFVPNNVKLGGALDGLLRSISPVVVMFVAVLGVCFASAGRKDVQLFVAITAAALVVVPSILQEVLALSRLTSGAGAGQANAGGS